MLAARQVDIAIMLAIVRHWVGEAWLPDELWTTEGPLPGNEHIPKIARVHHRAPFLGIPICSRLLRSAIDEGGEPSPPYEELELDRLGFVESVARVIETYLPTGQPSIQCMSRILGLGVRSLQRRLREHGTAYSHLLTEVLLRVAVDHLEATDASVTDIAHKLGYSDPTYFTRAFRRWTSPEVSTFAVSRSLSRR